MFYANADAAKKQTFTRDTDTDTSSSSARQNKNDLYNLCLPHEPYVVIHIRAGDRLRKGNTDLLTLLDNIDALRDPLTSLASMMKKHKGNNRGQLRALVATPDGTCR